MDWETSTDLCEPRDGDRRYLPVGGPGGEPGCGRVPSPCRGGLCGKRAKVYDKLWSVKAPRPKGLYFFAAVSFPREATPEGWGWRHIATGNHPGELGFDQNYFMWALQQTVGADPSSQGNGTLLYSAPIYPD